MHGKFSLQFASVQTPKKRSILIILRTIFKFENHMRKIKFSPVGKLDFIKHKKLIRGIFYKLRLYFNRFVYF
jgi:hypothetical protein